MDAADLDRLMAQAQRENAAIHAKLDNALRTLPQEYRARSRDGRVVAICDARARVTDIQLPYGLTSEGAAPWEAQEQLDAIGRAIVDVVNEIRNRAGEAGEQQYRQAFPGWFDLLTDLEPEPVTPPATSVPTTPPAVPLSPPPPTFPTSRRSPAPYPDEEDEELGPPDSWLE